MSVFDTHCHLGLDGGDARQEHQNALAAGVDGMLVVGIDLASSRQARALAATLPGVRWSAGLHPNAGTQFAAEWAELAELGRTPGCAAIGETGLDLFRDRCPLAQQLAALDAHIALANERSLPVILHCRDAFAPLLEALRRHRPARGVMHCFSGGMAEAEAALALGLHLSFAGPLTYPKNTALREVARAAPATSLLVETDAPFLPPQGFRGRRNEPALVVHTLAALAAARGIGVDEAAAITTQNARTLFGG